MIFTPDWGFVWTFLVSRPVIHSISTSSCSSIASWLAVSLAPTSVKAEWIWWNSVLFPRSRLALGLWFVIDLPHPGLTNPFSRLIVFPSKGKRSNRALEILQELRHDEYNDDYYIQLSVFRFQMMVSVLSMYLCFNSWFNSLHIMANLAHWFANCHGTVGALRDAPLY